MFDLVPLSWLALFATIYGSWRGLIPEPGAAGITFVVADLATVINGAWDQHVEWAAVGSVL